jgi:O-methyltransferase
MSAESGQAGLETLHAAVHYAYGMAVDGDVIEFGVMSGRTGALLARTIVECDRAYPHVLPKKLWLCDSFVGFPESSRSEDTQSPHVKSGIWGPGTNRGMDAGTVYGAILPIFTVAETDRLRVVGGWFKDTIPVLAADRVQGVPQFGVIHADCDLYVSTMDALNPLFANHCVALGAIILFDDWNCNYASRDFGQRAAWRDLVENYSIDWSDEGSYGVASHKFIVHGYR